MTAQAGAKRQSTLKVDPTVDELVSQGAHFLGVTKKDPAAEAVKDYLVARREEIYRATAEAMRMLDGTICLYPCLFRGIAVDTGRD